MQILARILDQFTVIVVTDQCDAKMLTDMHLQHASTFDEALNKALELKVKMQALQLFLMAYLLW